MKKSLLFAAMLFAGLTSVAQVAQLKDITPSGLNFDKYEDGAIFRVHVPADDRVSWASPAVTFNADDMKADNQFTAFSRYSVVPSAGDDEALRIVDFGGNIGKCLVFSTMYGPLQASLMNGMGPVPSVKAVGGNSKFQLAFYTNPANTPNGYGAKAIRVRIVYTMLQRSRHYASDNKDNMFVGCYSFNGGNYVPTSSVGNEAQLGIDKVGYNMNKYVKWVGEGDCLAEMPAEQVVLTGETDEIDTAGAAVSDVMANQLQRFHVVEFDTYAPTAGEPLIACFDFRNFHTSFIIKEVKFYEIENATDLLDADNDYEPIPGVSYLFDRHESYRYYTDKGMSEFEPGWSEEVVDPDPTVEGDGSEANPFKLTSASDLLQMYKLVSAREDYELTYVSLENDIDMEGKAGYVAMYGGGGNYEHWIDFEGNNHVISNLTTDRINESFSYPSLFGVASGSFRNFGLVNFTFNAEGDGAGALGGYGGHSSYDQPTLVDNVYVIGTINGGGAGYAGGLFGTTGGAEEVRITNSYARVTINNEGNEGNVAGLVGRIRSDVYVANSYVAGSIEGNYTAGLIGFNDKGTGTVDLNNAVSMLDNINGNTVDAVSNTSNTIKNNVSVWAETKVNGAAVEGGVSTADIQSTIMGWEAYHKTNLDGIYPILSWQTGDSSVEGIEIDENCDAAPVYYNLQGVRVAQPTTGLYIVVRGTKVSKEVVK